jgi:hypothetical protein
MSPGDSLLILISNFDPAKRTKTRRGADYAHSDAFKSIF